MEELMIYQKKSSNGQSGEYFFAYWISRNFGWPCRLLDIDIGIDAQVEILDDNQHTTGGFIAVQIKTTDGNNPNVPVNVDNLLYWKTFNDPVVIVSITTKTLIPRIYWKHLDGDTLDNLLQTIGTKGTQSVSVIFDKSKDCLSVEMKSNWKNLWLPREFKKLIENAKYLYNTSREWIDHFENDEGPIYDLSFLAPALNDTFFLKEEIEYLLINKSKIEEQYPIFDDAILAADGFIKCSENFLPKVFEKQPDENFYDYLGGNKIHHDLLDFIIMNNRYYGRRS